MSPIGLELADSWGTNRFGNFCKLARVQVGYHSSSPTAEPTGSITIEPSYSSGSQGPKLTLSRADAAALANAIDFLLLGK